MKVYKLVIIFVFCIFCFDVFSQDLIVTTNKDSINCSIQRITNKNFYYTIDKDTTSYKISLKEVVDYKYNYFKGIYVSKEIFTETETYNYDFLSIEFMGGKKIMAKTKDNPFIMHNLDSISGYKKTLSSGWFFGAAVTYYMNNYIGFGAHFDYYLTSIRSNDFKFELADTSGKTYLVNGYFSDKINIINGQFFISGKYNFPKQSYIYGNIGVIMLYFKNQHHYKHVDIDRLGTTIGFAADLGYDVKLMKNLSLGLNLSYSYGKLKVLTQNGFTNALNKNAYINISRYGVSLSCKIWLQQFNTKKVSKK